MTNSSHETERRDQELTLAALHKCYFNGADTCAHIVTSLRLPATDGPRFEEVFQRLVQYGFLREAYGTYISTPCSLPGGWGTTFELSDMGHDLMATTEAQLKADPLPLTVPKKDSAPVSPQKPVKWLMSWQDIVLAVDPKNEISYLKIIRLQEEHGGPITLPSKGSQPLVDEAKLIQWWNDLKRLFEEKIAAQAARLEVEGDAASGERLFDGNKAFGTVKKDQRPTGHLARKESRKQKITKGR